MRGRNAPTMPVLFLLICNFWAVVMAVAGTTTVPTTTTAPTTTAAPVGLFAAAVLGLAPDAYWQFAPGAVVIDSSGKINTLSASSLSMEQASVGGGLGLGAFLSGDENISVDVIHTSSTSRTILGWFCVGPSYLPFSNVKSVVYTGPRRAFRKNRREFEFTVFNDGSARLVATAVGEVGGARHARKVAAPAGTITLGDAHFFAAVIDLDVSIRTTAGLKLYIDGQLIGSAGFKHQDTTIYDSGEAMTIGRGLAGTQGFNGAVDDIAILPTALSAAQITSLFELATPATNCAAPLSTPSTTPASTTSDFGFAVNQEFAQQLDSVNAGLEPKPEFMNQLQQSSSSAGSSLPEDAMGAQLGDAFLQAMQNLNS
eukprot:m.308073 g.308073  ORF g.308073 m.308073 type:complete len:370 (+) comp20763_c0_seq1:31-1140(+)